MITICFVDGISLGPARCQVIANPILDEVTDENPMNSVILNWSKDQGFTGLDVNWPLTRIALAPENEAQTLLCGRLGFIGLIRGDSIIEETIEGPQTQGFIRDLRTIDQHVYAVGMGRQIYRRLSSNNWVRFDHGIINSSTDPLEVTGFNAINGMSEDDIYAVGFNGEIWHCIRDKWVEADSPTNLILERICVIKPDLVYVAGQAGVLLRGHGKTWEVIEQTATDDDFWGLEYFRNRLYLSTNNDVFRLNDHDELEQVDMGLPGPRTYSQLHASMGALWSFGQRHLCWTDDGETWNEVAMR